nr:MAG TPA: calponin domain protein [Bacteriophage sp.]
MQPNSVIQNYSELVEKQANQELEDWINKHKEDSNKSLDKLFED